MFLLLPLNDLPNPDVSPVLPIPPVPASPALPIRQSIVGLAPSVTRRLAGMLYESLLLFGVVFASGLLYQMLAQKRQGPNSPILFQVWLFVVIGAYFTFFWHRSGQTLAMKTWRIRLVSQDGANVSWRQAILRYVLAWLWFLPAIVLDFAFGLTRWPSIALIVFGIVLWLSTVRLDTTRHQFLHDRLAGTYLIDTSAQMTASS